MGVFDASIALLPAVLDAEPLARALEKASSVARSDLAARLLPDTAESTRKEFDTRLSERLNARHIKVTVENEQRSSALCQELVKNLRAQIDSAAASPSSKDQFDAVVRSALGRYEGAMRGPCQLFFKHQLLVASEAATALVDLRLKVKKSQEQRAFAERQSQESERARKAAEAEQKRNQQLAHDLESQRQQLAHENARRTEEHQRLLRQVQLEREALSASTSATSRLEAALREIEQLRGEIKRLTEQLDTQRFQLAYKASEEADQKRALCQQRQQSDLDQVVRMRLFHPQPMQFQFGGPCVRYGGFGSPFG
jgi:hypothetical protein